MRTPICCRRNKEISLDFDNSDELMTYSGLESCIRNSYSYENESGPSREAADSLDEEDSMSCSSSKDAFGSFSSQWLVNKQDDQGSDDWEEGGSTFYSPRQSFSSCRSRPIYTMQVSDVDAMKEKFSKLLLGDDISGGCKGISTALTLSNAITNLSATVFGELWKLEPLSEDRKSRWRREMDWLLSPTNYMVELVPAKQNGANGRTLEEVLDSMVDTEFWYEESGSRAEGRPQPKKKWWFPSPRVPSSGLSASQRKRLGFQGKFVHQVLKATKSINENVILQMPVPVAIRNALPKASDQLQNTFVIHSSPVNYMTFYAIIRVLQSGKASLGEDIYKVLTSSWSSLEEILGLLSLKSEHAVLVTVNRLETAVFAWKQRISDGANARSPLRNPWSYVKDVGSEHDRMGKLLDRAEVLLWLLKNRFPNIPPTFLDVTRVKSNKDIGHSIIEAYSRVIGNLAFSILSRIGEILQEDDLNKPSTPVATLKFDISSDVYLAGISETPPGHIRRSLINQMDMVDGRSKPDKAKALEESFVDNGTITISTQNYRVLNHLRPPPPWTPLRISLPH
ncbi:Rop guanine nucleotide exchange factor 1 [Acorus gramineus]|uniref:Rop guanine nucleotide exchange factor 1 n=1 Tax=Acorus gramineus TaxID=55184 RepID=A0AAV9B7Z2_ACOGR|nr:Rop guanine nucleotide exchange factor 1 [Acorus gramineus]